jgi:toxin ParE1/3/4
MGLIRRTPESDTDLRNIYRYIEVDNPAAAEGMLRRFRESLSMLSDMPGGEPARPEFGKDVRSFPVGKYLLLYRRVGGGIELLRVIHGARKVRRIYRKGGP